MKRIMLFVAVAYLLLAGCGGQEDSNDVAAPVTENVSGETPTEQNPPDQTEQENSDNGEQESTADAESKAPAITVRPLPNTTMENLSDAILAVSLEEGDAYLDDSGIMQMAVTIYAYDIYDMRDISQLKTGDTIVTHAGDVEILSLERNTDGAVCINGGLENGGFDLVAGGGGILYEIGYNDARNWYAVGEATIRVSVDFVGRDSADPEQGEIVFHPGSFLVGEITDYNFTPYNTTIRVAGGQVVELNRVYTP